MNDSVSTLLYISNPLYNLSDKLNVFTASFMIAPDVSNVLIFLYIFDI